MKHLQANLSTPRRETSDYSYELDPLPRGPTIAIPMHINAIRQLTYYKVSGNVIEPIIYVQGSTDFLHYTYPRSRRISVQELYTHWFRNGRIGSSTYYFRTLDEALIELMLNDREHSLLTPEVQSHIRLTYPEYFI